MTSELLAGIAGVVLSLVFSYVPQVKERYEKLTSAGKGLVMLLLMAVVSAGAFGLSCTDSPIITGVTCDETGAWGMLAVFISALVANQATYLLSPQKKSAAVIEAQPEGESSFIDYPAAVDSPVAAEAGRLVDAQLRWRPSREITRKE